MVDSDKNEIIALLSCGKKLEAIQFITQRTEMTLKEAKDYVEKLIFVHHIKVTTTYSCIIENEQCAYFKCVGEVKTRIERTEVPLHVLKLLEQIDPVDRIKEVDAKRLTLGKRLIITFGLLTLSALLMFMMIKWRASQFSSGNRITRFDIWASTPTFFVILIWIPINRVKAIPDGPKKVLIILGLAMAVLISVVAIFYLWIHILHQFSYY